MLKNGEQNSIEPVVTQNPRPLGPPQFSLEYRGILLARSSCQNLVLVGGTAQRPPSVCLCTLYICGMYCLCLAIIVLCVVCLPVTLHRDPHLHPCRARRLYHLHFIIIIIRFIHYYFIIITFYIFIIIFIIIIYSSLTSFWLAPAARSCRETPPRAASPATLAGPGLSD